MPVVFCSTLLWLKVSILRKILRTETTQLSLKDTLLEIYFFDRVVCRVIKFWCRTLSQVVCVSVSHCKFSYHMFGLYRLPCCRSSCENYGYGYHPSNCCESGCCWSNHIVSVDYTFGYSWSATCETVWGCCKLFTLWALMSACKLYLVWLVWLVWLTLIRLNSGKPFIWLLSLVPAL